MPACSARLRWRCSTSARNNAGAAALQRFVRIATRTGNRRIRHIPLRHAAVAPFTCVIPGAAPQDRASGSPQGGSAPPAGTSSVTTPSDRRRGL